jgi:RHS repeat-associated protein
MLGVYHVDSFKNGALKSDANKGVSLVEHNTFLNKISKVTYGNGDWIEFTYDGSGTLIKRENSNGDYWEYADKYIFKNGLPYSIAILDGRASFEEVQWKYEFEFRDVWNNLRVVFGADGNRLVKKQQSDYDVFGMELFGLGMESTPENLFKFQGKEKIKELGWYNFGARMYNPEIGRFLSVDAKASQMPAWSPYNAFKNNLLRYIDPDGNAPLDIIIILQRNAQTGTNSQVRYYQGNLFNMDGSNYKPDMMGHFAGKIQSTLNDIRSSDSYLEKIVSTLESSDAGNHYIQLTDNEKIANSVTGFGNQGSTMMWLGYDSIKEGKYKSGEKKTFGSVMAHELSHHYDRETNQQEQVSPGTKPEKKPNEIRAVNVENRYRHNRGIELRTHYEGKIDNSKLEDPKKEKQ